MGIDIVHADILSWAASYDGPLFHALLCDAPYEMEFMGKGWDNSGIAFNPETWKAIARCLHPGAFLFVFAGTINDDLISVAMRQAGLRKYHKAMAWGYGSGFPKATDLPAQIDEDAFQRWLTTHAEERAIIVQFRDAVQNARRAHKSDPHATPRAVVNAAHTAYRAKRLAIKAAAGFLKTKGTKKHQPKFAAAELGYREKDNGYNSKERASYDVSIPATPMAQTWDGYAYGGQMIKPAVESILIFQKPYAGRPVDSITATGAGALWIDGGRIGTDDERPTGSGDRRGSLIYAQDEYTQTRMANGGNATPAAGRWPANLLLSHSPACEQVGTRRVKGTLNTPRNRVTFQTWQGASDPTQKDAPSGYADADGIETIADWRCVESCPIRRLGEQSGESTSTGGRVNPTPNTFKRKYQAEMGYRPDGDDYAGEFNNPAYRGDPGLGDTGTAARFFFNADFMAERLEDADPVVYQAKADRSEREAGLDPRQVRLLGMMEVKDGGQDHSAYGEYKGIPGTKHTPNQRRQFDLDTINDGRAKPIDNAYQRGKTTRRNTHPTIKPIALARHLATLLLPPDLYAPRRLLIPFSGAGSEMIGALLAGWEEIVGVELEDDHVRIAEARIAYWQQRRHELLDPAAPITAELRDAPDGQLELF